MGSASQRLIKRAEQYERSTTGIGLDSIKKMECDDGVVTDIFECLRSEEPKDVHWGLWFCRGLMESGKLPRHALSELLGRFPLLVGHADSEVRGALIGCLVLARTDLPLYREWLIQLLRDEAPSVRSEALGRCETFLKKGEVEPLLSFEKDSYLAEVSMYGPVHYVLRNAALTKIESLLGRQFPKHELTEAINGEVVFWWDWKPFREWWGRQKRKWRFW